MEEQKRHMSSLNDKERSGGSYADKVPSNTGTGDERRKSEHYQRKPHTSSSTRNPDTSHGGNVDEDSHIWQSSRSSNAADTTHPRHYQRDGDRTRNPSRTRDDLISPRENDRPEVPWKRYHETQDDSHNGRLSRDASGGRQSHFSSVGPSERAGHSEAHSYRVHDTQDDDDRHRRRKHEQEGSDKRYENSRHRHHHHHPGHHKDSDRTNEYSHRQKTDNYGGYSLSKDTPGITDRTDSSMEPEHHELGTSGRLIEEYRSSASRSHSHSHTHERDHSRRHLHQGEVKDDDDDQERGRSSTRSSSGSNRSRSSTSSTSSTSSRSTARRGSSSRHHDRSHSQSRPHRSRSRSRSRSRHKHSHGHKHRSGSKRSSHKERRDDGRDAKEKHKRKRRDRSDSRDRKRRRRKEKEKEKEKGRNKEKEEERRSVLTGKKIKLKVKKDKGDHERDANRKDLLQFLNSTFG